MHLSECVARRFSIDFRSMSTFSDHLSESKAGHLPTDEAQEVFADGLTPDQVSQAHAVFSRADIDGGGTLDRKELRAMFAQLGLVLTDTQMAEYVDTHALLADKDDESVCCAALPRCL
jgi:hypothetical protein